MSPSISTTWCLSRLKQDGVLGVGKGSGLRVWEEGPGISVCVCGGCGIGVKTWSLEALEL